MAVTPPVPLYRYEDFWGTVVHAFDVHEPHRELAVVARATVETPRPAGLHDPAGWEVLRAPATRDRLWEWLQATPHTTPTAELEEVAARLAGGRTPLAAAVAVIEWVRTRLRYQRGVTGVHTTAAEALDAGAGVCQDLAHVALALLRAAGVPARYVSGYVHPDGGAPPGATVRGQSHAWVEVWAGGWLGLDTTNGAGDGPAVGPRHVVVGRGRDYTDVPPLKGVYQGVPAEHLEVEVEMTRLPAGR